MMSFKKDRVYYDGSSYYPPRANKFNSIISRFVSIKNKLLKDQRPSPSVNKRLLFNILIPGYSFLETKPFIWRIIFIVYWLCFITLVVFAGFKIGNYAFTLMIFLHTLSLINYLSREPNLSNLSSRFISGILVSAAVYCFYTLIVIGLLDRLFIPVRIDNENVYVAKRLYGFKNLRIGDKIAYYKEGYYGYDVAINSGKFIGTIIAKGGDKIKFRESIIMTKKATYPKTGIFRTFASNEYIVPPDCYFVFPERGSIMAVNRANNVSLERYINLFLVSDQDYIGYIPKKWFCRWQYIN